MQCIRVAEKRIGSGAYTPSLKNTRYDNEHEGFIGSIGAAHALSPGLGYSPSLLFPGEPVLPDPC